MTQEELREWYINDIESKQIVIDDLQAQLSAKEQECEDLKTSVNNFTEMYQDKCNELASLRAEIKSLNEGEIVNTNVIKSFEIAVERLRAENELKDKRIAVLTEEIELLKEYHEKEVLEFHAIKGQMFNEANIHYSEYAEQINVLRKRCEDLEAAMKCNSAVLSRAFAVGEIRFKTCVLSASVHDNIVEVMKLNKELLSQ